MSSKSRIQPSKCVLLANPAQERVMRRGISRCAETLRRYCWCAAALGLFAATIGCQTPAQKLEPGSDAMIQPGITTADEVIKVFGPPAQRLAGKDRTLMLWRIVYWASPTAYPGSISMGPSEDSHARGLSVLFDQDNRVVAKHYSAHSFRTTFGAANVSAGTRFDAQILSQIKPYATKKAEAVALLGEPMMESLTLNGNLLLEWAYLQGDAIVGRTQLRKLEVVIGPSDTVLSLREVDER